jgi:hypothetical protein
MKEKDKEDESNKKEESHPIVADPRLDKTVLHNLVWTGKSKIVMEVIDPNKKEQTMNKDKETNRPDKETQIEKPSTIEAVPELDHIVKKGLDPDKEERQKQKYGRK